MLDRQEIDLLPLFSKYRTQIMGISTIFIILCHNSLYLPDSLAYINANFIKPFLQCAVDMFLLLSGMGCNYSISRNSVFSFYKHRLLRLFPTYLLFVVLYGVVNIVVLKNSILEFLWHYSLISFYIDGDLTVWFIAAILSLYLVFPVLYKVLNKSEKTFIVMILFIVALVMLPFWNDMPLNISVLGNIMLTRIPIFMFGALVGKRILHPTKFYLRNKGWVYAILLIVCIGFYITNIVFNSYETIVVSRLLHFPISCLIVSIFCCLFEKFSILNKKFNKVLISLGGITLEVYLIHERVLSISDGLLWKIPMNDYYVSIMSNFVSMVLAIMLAFALHYLVNIRNLTKKQTSE